MPRIFDGEKEAKLIALACSKPPKGRARWTLRLLENKVVALGIVDRARDSTIGRAVKKTFSSPIAGVNWVIPPKANGAFEAAMEDVLSVYTRPHDHGSWLDLAKSELAVLPSQCLDRIPDK